MTQFLKALRKLPVKEQLKDIAIFINRELLPFVGELQTSIDTTNEDNSSSFDDLAEPEYIVKSANATLVNERVADDSTEIDLDYTTPSIVSWFLKTASVAFSKLSNLNGLSVLGRASNSSGVMAAITATAANQRLVSSSDFTSLSFVNDLPAVHSFTVNGALGQYLLPAAFHSGDTIRFTITADTTLNGLLLSTGALAPEGMTANICLSDQSGGAAPGWTFSVLDDPTNNGGFRTPGQVQGTSPGPSYVMQSEEEAFICAFQTNSWRILGGTAGQAITGDVVVSSGNGSSRVAAIGNAVIVDADVNATAAIAQTKLGATTGFSVKASGASATTSAEPIVTYSATANMSAERVTTSSTSITVSTSVASQIEFQRAALTGDVTASANANATTLANAVVSPVKLAVQASNIAAMFSIKVTCAAGAAGAADDVTIYNANAPFAFLILDCLWLDSTAIALSTVQLRDTAGGGGAALSSALTAAVTGTARNNDTQTRAVAANGSVFLRRTDRGVAGEIIIICIRT